MLRSKLINILVIIAFFYSYLVNLDLLYHRFLTDRSYFLKYIPTGIFFVILLVFIFVLLNKKGNRAFSFNYTFLLIIFWFIEMLMGSLITIFYYHNSAKDSFLGRALNVVILLSSYLYFKYSVKEVKLSFIGKYISMSKLFGVIYLFVIYIYLFAGRPEYLKNGESVARQVYHVEIFYIVPIFIFVSNGLAKLFFLLSGFASWKNTGFIISVMSVFCELKDIYVRIRDFGQRLFYIFSIIFLLLILFLVAYNIWNLLNVALPKGSPEVRLVTYGMRLEAFIASPFYGSFFVGNPNIELGNIYIPSHSDFLDLLAFGGILGITPLLIIFIKVLKLKCSYSEDHLKLMCRYSKLIVINAFIAMMFNPLILQPSLAIFFYFWLGFLLSQGRYARSQQI